MYNHREIARLMDLFHFEEHSPGMIFWGKLNLDNSMQKHKTS